LLNIGSIAFKPGRTYGRCLGWFWLCFFWVCCYRESWWMKGFFGVYLWSLFLELYLLPFML